MTLVTIDFHNTLFECDDWFQLEIRMLPVAFLRWRGDLDGDAGSAGEIERITAGYCALRQGVMQSGIECDAVSSVHQVLQSFGYTASDREVEDGVERLMRRATKQATPKPGAVELVSALHEREIPLAVVSSAAYHPFLEWCIEHYGMRDAFTQVITSASCGIYKSNPAIYQHALDLFATEPDRAVHIGDSHRYDVASASKVGMRTILYSARTEPDLDPQPDAVITHLGDAILELDRLLDTPSAR